MQPIIAHNISFFRAPRHKRGAVLIEAAFVLPVLILLIFGAIEFGYYLYTAHNLEGAAREGARAAIVANSKDPNGTAAVQAMMNAAGITGYTVQTTSTLQSDGSTLIQVTVSIPWSSVGISPLGLISGSTLVKGNSVMRKEDNI